VDRKIEVTKLVKSLVTATCLVGVVLTGSLQAALAADGEGNFAVKGAGLETCRTYLAARDEAAARFLVFRTWVNGFVTAYNMQTSDTFDVSPMHSIEALSSALANVCEDMPDEAMVNAVASLVAGLAPARSTRKSEPLSISFDGRTVQISSDLFARVQQELRERGFYNGAVDSKYGPGTRRALEAYQESMEIRQTGLPDRATVIQLMGSGS
jgi:hypothetical protein